jgi:hypothetical protein
MSKPSSCGQKWSDEEEYKLLEELNNNLNIYQIAKNHNRTRSGITCRIKKISERLVSKLNKDTRIDDISQLKNEIIGLKYAVRVLSELIKSK